MVFEIRDEIYKKVEVNKEENKPIVTEEVFDWYKNLKEKNLLYSEYIVHEVAPWSFSLTEEVNDWLYDKNLTYKEQAIRTHAIITLLVCGSDSVTILKNKKKKYRVYLAKAITPLGDYQMLLSNNKGQYWFGKQRKIHSSSELFNESFKETFTKKELEEAGYSSVFNNELFIVKEAKD